MAVRHQLIRRSPEELWAVLADRDRYQDRVVGTARARPNLVIVDEHPLTGPGGRLHHAALDLMPQLRHRSLLHRPADVAEETPAHAAAGA
ncbi:hypothetical protein ACWC9R_23945 [Streptomyces sp. NPDC001219]